MSSSNARFGDAVGATDVGRRSHNEDAYLVRPELGLVLVADGVGGHLAGEIASAITCATIAGELERNSSLEEAVRSANREVMAAVAEGRGKHGMASTVVAAKLDGADFEVAWVGDSRAYLWDGQLKLLTRDHSLMEALLARGYISRDELKDHPQRHVIAQAIGLQAEDKLTVGINRGTLRQGGLLILCSDGMSDVLDNAAIAEILSAGDSLQERCQRLVKTSIDQGGKDNATVVLVSAAESAAAGGVEPDVIWSFDPLTGEVSGLDDVAPVAPATAESVRVDSRSVSGSPGPHTTQMFTVAELEQALGERGEDRHPVEERGGPPGRGGRRPAGLWLAVIAVVAAALGLAWYLGAAELFR